MRDKQFYRIVISHRAAIKALEDINCALTDSERPNFYGYGYCDYKEIGGYDPSVRNMADDIKALVKEVKEYRKLKEALKPILGIKL